MNKGALGSCLFLFTATAVTLAGCSAGVQRDGDDQVDKTTGTTTQKLEGDKCTAEKAEFETWEEIQACQSANPALYEAAVQVAVKAGQECTKPYDDGYCGSIEPIKDVRAVTERIGNINCHWAYDCTTINGRKYCYKYYECCTNWDWNTCGNARPVFVLQ